MEYDKIELQFEEFSVNISYNAIKKFQTKKVEQFIEPQYNPEDIYNIYMVIDRILAEQEDKLIVNKINSNSIYSILLYKDEKEIKRYEPVWTYTQFTNNYQKIGITDELIIIRIKEI